MTEIRLPAACPQCLASTRISADRRLGDVIGCRRCGGRSLAADWVATQRRLVRGQKP